MFAKESKKAKTTLQRKDTNNPPQVYIRYNIKNK